MKMKKTYIFILSVLALLSCSGEPREALHTGPVSFSIGAQTGFPSPGALSRVALSDGKAVWEGNEVMSVLLGNGSSTSVDEGKQVMLPSTVAGVFTGTADISPFTVADIQGAVVPASNGAWYDGAAGRLVVNVAGAQIQKRDGVFNGDNVPFYSFINPGSFIQNDDVFTLHSMTMKPGCAIIRFNVYGSAQDMAADESLKSITLYAADGKGLNGSAKVGSDGTWTISGVSSGPVKAMLGETAVVAGKTRDNGVKLFASVLPYGSAGESVVINKIVISTDKADYKATFNEALSPKAGEIIQAAIDLSGFGDRQIHAEYSTDDGATWSLDLPAHFYSLAVRGNLQESDLQDIRTAIDAQPLPVDLDLSRCSYSDKTFPAIFSGTPASPCALLKSIILPSGVTDLADRCFMNCTAMNTMDFTGIKSIGQYAFGNVPIHKVDMSMSPEGTVVSQYAFLNDESVLNPNVTIDTVILNKNITLSDYSFYRLHALKYLYFDVPTAGIAFSWQTSSYVTSYDHKENLTVVLGPNVKSMSLTFWTNANVDKVIFEDGATGLTGNVFGCCRWLREIECHATTTAPSILNTTFRYYDSAGNYASRTTGYYVSNDLKKLIVPAGSESIYNKSYWKSVVQDQLNYTLTPVSF